jgi:hypothetical protein
VKLGAKAVIDGEVYDYCISFDRQAFQSEKLTRLNGEDPVVLIDRIGQDVTGAWKEEAQFQLLSKSFRANALLLSLADILAPGLAKRISVGFRRVLATRSLTPGAPWSLSWRVGHPQSIARRARKDTEFSEWLLSRLKHADLGVVGLRTEEERQLTLFSSVDEESGEEGPPREGVETFVRLALLHGGTAGPVELPYLRESLGTQRLVELSPLLYDLAHDTRSRAAFVDEFDASMHPLLLHALIRHFNCEIPPDEARGQLIFATHETALLDDEAKHAVLRRDQVYFTEKDASGASRLYSVAEFKERNNLNVRRRYLQGRYGALPSLGLFAE